MMVKKKITKKVYDKTRAGKHDARGVLLNTRQHRVLMIYIYIYINLMTFRKPKVVCYLSTEEESKESQKIEPT